MNFTLNPRSDADRVRIVTWAKRFGQLLESEQTEAGHIVFGYGKDSLAATSAYSSLKRIANFDVL